MVAAAVNKWAITDQVPNPKKSTNKIRAGARTTRTRQRSLHQCYLLSLHPSEWKYEVVAANFDGLGLFIGCFICLVQQSAVVSWGVYFGIQSSTRTVQSHQSQLRNGRRRPHHVAGNCSPGASGQNVAMYPSGCKALTFQRLVSATH
jgi:hypothetical protein